MCASMGVLTLPACAASHTAVVPGASPQFLDELLFLFCSEQIIAKQVNVESVCQGSKWTVECRISGEKFESDKHEVRRPATRGLAGGRPWAARLEPLLPLCRRPPLPAATASCCDACIA